MDVDLFADIFNDGQPVLSGSLLSHVSDTVLTVDETAPAPTSSLPGIMNSSQPGAVVSKIEDIFERVAGCILDEKMNISIQLKTRGKRSAIGRDSTTGTIRSLPDEKMRSVEFPSKSPKEAWKFTALLRILELSHEALVTGVVTTKRDMFYRDPELFIKQAVVDRYVDELAYTLGVERDALNVVAAAKGLVAGSFQLIRNDNSIVDYSAEAEGVLIPNTREIKSFQLEGLQWILVIEKEATFRTLATNKYWETSLAGKGIIVTVHFPSLANSTSSLKSLQAKGYPDIQTRQFLRLLSTHVPTIFILVDFDPDGVGIMSTYKYGSIALAHESQHLAVPSTRWLGIRSSDIIQDSCDKTGLLKLSKRDRRIAMRMLEKDIFGEEGREKEWRRELQVMLMLNVKAEIQILSSGDGLEGWLDGKLLLAKAELVDGL